MQNEQVDFVYKILLAFAGGIFGIAIAIAVQHIKLIGVPRVIIFISIAVQLILSWGVFIFILILFKSAFLPEAVPSDDWSALTLAYFLSAIPHIVVATAILIYNKEINKWLESRYGSGEVPSVENAAMRMHEQENITDNVAKPDVEIKEEDLEVEEEPHICPACNQELKEEK